MPSDLNLALMVLSAKCPIVVFAVAYSYIYIIVFMRVAEEEREQVERLRWPSRGYLQELSEYQQRRRKLRKSRCIVM